MKTSEVIRSAMAAITPIGRWLQYGVAAGGDGEYRPPSSDDACCWCPIGAVQKQGLPLAQEYKALDALDDASPPVDGMYRPIAVLNDTGRTRWGVLGVMGIAAQRLEALGL